MFAPYTVPSSGLSTDLQDTILTAAEATTSSFYSPPSVSAPLRHVMIRNELYLNYNGGGFPTSQQYERYPVIFNFVNVTNIPINRLQGSGTVLCYLTTSTAEVRLYSSTVPSGTRTPVFQMNIRYPSLLTL